MEKSHKRVVILVSSDPSDIYFANRVSERVNAAGIVVEHQHEPGGLARKFAKLLKLAVRPKQFFAALERRQLERGLQQKAMQAFVEGFGVDAFELNPPPDCIVSHHHGSRAINSPTSVSVIQSLKPDLVVVCGTSILDEQVLSIPSQGVLNLHGGLSQKYRGVWTTHWAVFNEEPEHIGATVHFVSAGIDDGDIVFQGRPELDGSENPELLYVKVVKLGIEMMVRAVQETLAGNVRRFPLEVKGKLYLSRQMTPEILDQAWSKAAEGVVKVYLAEKSARDTAILPLLRGLYCS